MKNFSLSVKNLIRKPGRTAALALLTRWVQRGRRTQTTRWPLALHARTCLWEGALPLAAGLALLALAAAWVSSGSAWPLALPYVPLLNTGDAPLVLAAAALLFWRRAVLRFSPAIEAALRFLSGRVFWAAAGVAAFIAISTVWLRVAHHWFGVPWRVGDLAESFVVQAGYSILWSLLALALMVAAHRRRQHGDGRRLGPVFPGQGDHGSIPPFLYRAARRASCSSSRA